MEVTALESKENQVGKQSTKARETKIRKKESRWKGEN
jgi:hypothetical protein